MYNILMNSILVNEHKGILLSLILWITKYQSKLSNKLIQINLSKYQIPLAKLFPNLKWISSLNSNQKIFNIQIQSQLLGDLNIGYIDTYTKINSAKVYLAPWSDPDNPIVMFVPNNKTQNIQKIKSQIVSMDKTQTQKLTLWSSQIEQKIFDQYFKTSNVFTSINQLVKYIESLFNQVIIKKKSQLKNLVMPNFIPNFIPIVFSTNYRNQIDQIKEMIEKKENKYKDLIKKEEPSLNINPNKEIKDLREIIELLNQNIKMLEENTTMAINAINPVQGGGGLKKSKSNKDLTDLLSRAIKISNKYKIKFYKGDE